MPSGLLGNPADAHVLDIPAMLDSGIGKQVAELVAMGVLVSIGSTRDRGALSLTVTHDGLWDREYFRRSDEAEDWLRHAIDVLRGRGLTVNEREPTSAPLPSRRRQKLT